MCKGNEMGGSLASGHKDCKNTDPGLEAAGLGVHCGPQGPGQLGLGGRLGGGVSEAPGGSTGSSCRVHRWSAIMVQMLSLLLLCLPGSVPRAPPPSVPVCPALLASYVTTWALPLEPPQMERCGCLVRSTVTSVDTGYLGHRGQEFVWRRWREMEEQPDALSIVAEMESARCEGRRVERRAGAGRGGTPGSEGRWGQVAALGGGGEVVQGMVRDFAHITDGRGFGHLSILQTL